MNPSGFRFSLLQCLAALALMTTSAFAGEPGAIAVFISPSQPVLLRSDGAGEMARVRMMLNFESSESGSSHPGGVNIALADGSVYFLHATTAQLIVDPKGDVVEVQAAAVDTRTMHAWTITILPYIEEGNLYSVFLTDGLVRIEFDAVGHLLPVTRTAAPAQGVTACAPGGTDVRPGGWILDVSYQPPGSPAGSSTGIRHLRLRFHNIAADDHQFMFYLGGIPIDGTSNTVLVAEGIPSLSCDDADGDGRVGLVGLQFLLRDVRTGALVPGSIVPNDGELDDDGEEEVTVVIGDVTVVGEAVPHFWVFGTELPR